MVLGVDPPLTSVDMCRENVGRVGGGAPAFRAERGFRLTACAPCPGELVVRGSTMAETAVRG